LKDTNFIKSLARQCHETFGDDCGDLTVIFPNKRAGLYFSKYLAELIDKPIWSPKVCSLEEFVYDQCDTALGDDLQLNLLLYKVYGRLNQQAESFDHFYSWGEMILKDFNDIDNYLIDVDHIFRVVKSQKDLDESFYFLSDEDQKIIQRFWKGFLPTPSKTQSDFLKTWKILKDLYLLYGADLDRKKIAYKGKIFRHFSDTVDLETIGEKPNWLAGFNAFTRAEEKIVKAILKGKHADIFWDIDTYYIEDKNQEAGFFFRQYAKDPLFKQSIERDLSGKIGSTPVKFELAAAPLSMAQVKYGCQKLESWIGEKGMKPEETVVVLPDERLLLPLMDSLPIQKLADEPNVSMGLALNNTRLFKLFEAVLKLTERSTGSESLRFDALFSLFPYADLLDLNERDLDAFRSEAIEKNRVYLSKNLIRERLPELSWCVAEYTDTTKLLEVLVQFLDRTADRLNKIELAGAAQLKNQLRRIVNSMSDFKVNLEIKSLRKIFLKLGNVTKITLAGDPISGVQIMGALETRNLTFKNVIILSMNEGTWPTDASGSSFIPYNVRKAFDLPVQTHQNAMQSYLFYRLLHEAENVCITYNNISEFNQNGELSRYLRQLGYESDLSISKTTVANPVSLNYIKPIVIQKKNELWEKLTKYLINGGQHQKRLSPSAINTYLDCRLKFYFNYVEGIKEPDEIKDDMDPSLFGNLIHATMENLYVPFIGKQVSRGDFTTIRQNKRSAIESAFKKFNMAVEDNHQIGLPASQVIAHEVISTFVDAILKYDLAHSGFKILALEAEDYYFDFAIESDGQPVTVGLKGIIDRIDQKDAITRIIDYKSGRDTQRLGKLEKMIDREATDRKKAAFQLLYYCMLYDENNPVGAQNIVPGMFNSHDLFSKDFSTSLKMNQKNLQSYGEVKVDFQAVLSELLTEIFDPQIPFDQTKDERKCGYCSYSGVCMRS